MTLFTVHRPRRAALALAAVLVAVLCCCTSAAVGFYIPGAEVTYHKEGGDVEVWVNSIRSNSYLFPQDYYHLPFCAPAQVKKGHDSIGETIWGDRKLSSMYVLKMRQNSSCTSLPGCDVKKNNDQMREPVARRRLKTSIERGYRGFMSIDNLPVFGDGTPPLSGKCNAKLPKDQRNFKQRGYALGVPSACTNATIVNNHLHFTVYYNNRGGSEKEFMVVGLRAVPYSIRDNAPDTCAHPDFEHASAVHTALTVADLDLTGKAAVTVYWTYSVGWVKSDVTWATRWDEYFRSSQAGSNSSIHVLYMGSGLCIVAIVASGVSFIFMRALRKDIVRYNTLNDEELQEETGWKLVHADVFRPPDHAGLLSIMFGNGAQIVAIFGCILLFSVIGLLSPSRRGSLVATTLSCVIITAFIDGYACGFMQRYLNCKSWRDVILSGCALQGVVCGVYLLTAIIGKFHKSTTAAGSGVFLILFGWLAVSLPLTILGASFAFRQEPFKNPIAVGRLAREIPKQPAMNEPMFLFTVPPLFPLATIILEIHFVMQALWAGQVYQVFGFLAATAVLWAFVTALVTVSQLYYVLCYENHRWWWIAFICPGALGAHLFVYSVYFYYHEMAVTSAASGMLYFLYMGIICYGYGLAAGTIGLSAGIAFARLIYGSIKVD